jgi:hypothetical protein
MEEGVDGRTLGRNDWFVEFNDSIEFRVAQPTEKPTMG